MKLGEPTSHNKYRIALGYLLTKVPKNNKQRTLKIDLYFNINEETTTFPNSLKERFRQLPPNPTLSIYN